ncbi:PAAR domain-containing protein [Commensalibacter nepenthis]|uniref:PAAR domain-containing protein n=1 Tax=Commensalibacter nepenthis TaxID=3043872 RepID=A0ABT6QAN5_9PROT|nr:PAAR domain-containing protein [Commensalibacter sp. TBRC 10068]MDI2113957.1 PAAR domain-containing protein [Commensalibacter sp. TBRC 10068]
MVKALIRKGDMTTHGGKVIEGFSDYTIQNIPVAGVGHKTICPLCKGVFPIIQGYGGITVNGIFVALEGHVTACGAKLIPSQHEEVVDEGGGDDVMGAAAQQPEQTQYARLSDNQQSMINDGVYRPNHDQGKITSIADENSFNNINPPDRSLPMDKHGRMLPDREYPHTQYAIKKSKSKPGSSYPQAREWDYDKNGKLVPKRDIDFTDHNRPSIHTDPHQHEWIKRSEKGSLERGDPKPIDIPKDKGWHNEITTGSDSKVETPATTDTIDPDIVDPEIIEIPIP